MSEPPAPAPSLRTSGVAAGAVSGLALTACAFLPLWGGAIVFLALGWVLAYGWPRLVNLPSPRGTTAVLGLTALVLDAVMLMGSSGHRTRWAGVTLCLGLIGSFLHQLLRQDGRPRLVTSLAGTALGLGFLGAGSYVLAAHDNTQARHLLLAAGLSVTVGALAERFVPASAPRQLGGATDVVLGALVGLLALLIGADLWRALLTGAAAGLLCWSALRTTVTKATSAHTRAQLAAGASAGLLCCFLPFVVGAI